LKVPNVEVVNLEARLSSAISAEAQQKECDYVIYTNVSHKKGGGGGFGGMFGQALGSAIGQTGIGHTGSVAGNIAGQIATQGIVSATSVSSSVKSKDEITLDLKLNKADGGAALAKVYKVKAKSNGDDVISQVIEQAAEEIVRVIGQ
jgi:outer membrane lipoprotein SlyB